MMTMVMKTLLAFALAATVAGCKTFDVPRPPDDKLNCESEPGRPAGLGPNGEVTDEENGTYLRELRATGQSCRDDVNWLRRWFEELG